MKPLSALPSTEARNLHGLIFDLDDTFLSGTRLVPKAYAALFELRNSGLELLVATGRPASWASLVVRMWPIAGALAENGAIAFRMAEGGLQRFDTASEGTRAQRRQRLAELVAQVRQELPELVPADDVFGRDSDFTFDIGEHQHAPESVIARAQQLARQRGARTTRSSVHLHLTFDRHDKATGLLHLLSNRGIDPTGARHRYAYVGDSENDAPCFAAFATSIGVANLSGRLSLPPRYRTEAPRSAGFIEAAKHIVEARTGPSATPTAARHDGSH